MKVIAAYLAAVSGASVTLLVVFLALGRTSSAAAWPAVVVAVALAVAAWRTQSAAEPAAAGERGRPDVVGWALIALAGVFVARTGLWLAWELDGQLWVGSPYNLGDFALHLTHVRQLAEPVPFWPQNPISAADPLTYPLGMALWHVLLVWLGLPVLGAFALTTLVGLGFGMAAAWRWGRGFGLAALLLNGGVAGWAALAGGGWVDHQADLAWKNIPLTMLVTQRGFLYALPAGLWLMSRWHRCLVRGRRELNWFDVWVYGTLPLFHLHTFLALTAVLFVWVWVNPERRRVVLHGLAAVPPAVALGWLVTGGGSHTGTSGPAWGWFAKDDQGTLDALWQNFGPWLVVLPPLTLWLAWRRTTGRADQREHEGALWMLPGMVVLLFSLVWKLQPWPWDNTKLMLWGWLACAPFVWRLCLQDRTVWLRAIACAGLFGGGFLSLTAGLGTGLRGGYSLATLRDIDAARQVRALLPPDAVVAAAPTYKQPLLLAGQGVVLGYDGHLWSHGIDYQERMTLLNRLLRGHEDWPAAARRLGVTHLYWGRLEWATYPDSTRAWRRHATLVHDTPVGSLYRLNDE